MHPTSSPPQLSLTDAQSKWSSSTICSICEEHERRGPFLLPSSYLIRDQESCFLHDDDEELPGCGHGRHPRRESDVMIIGYGYGNGVRRRGSVSDAGSDDSALSSTSSGLRRVPIPVEMFLKGSSSSIYSCSFTVHYFLFYITHPS